MISIHMISYILLFYNNYCNRVWHNFWCLITDFFLSLTFCSTSGKADKKAWVWLPPPLAPAENLNCPYIDFFLSSTLQSPLCCAQASLDLLVPTQLFPGVPCVSNKLPLKFSGFEECPKPRYLNQIWGGSPSHFCRMATTTKK